MFSTKLILPKFTAIVNFLILQCLIDDNSFDRNLSLCLDRLLLAIEGVHCEIV